MKKINILLFVLLIYLSLILRSVEVLCKNFLFGFDQGRDYLAVKDIVVNHKLTLIGSEIGAGSAGFQGIFHGPFHYYFLSIPFIILGGDPYGGIVLMFLFGIASIVLGYFLGKKLFGTTGGIVSALLVAISPPLISQSRFVWNSHPSTLFILLAFYFVYLFTKNKNKKSIFFASFFSGFIYNFELAISIPISITLVLYCIFILRLRNLKHYFLLLSGFILAFLPMLFFELRHGFMGLNGFKNYLLHHEETAVTLTFLQLLTKDHFDSFWFNFSFTFPRQTFIPAILIFLVVFLPALFFFLKEKNTALKNFFKYLLILIPVNFLVFFPLRNAVYAYYLIDLNLSYIFLFSYSIFSAYKNKHLIFKFLLTSFLIIFLVQAIIYYTPNAKYDYSDYGGDAKIKGRLDALDYIYKDAKKEKFGLLVFSPPIYTYPYDYLIWWYGQRKYGYVPYKNKKGLFYLLVEKDSSKPWSYKGWMETVIKTGRVVETKTLPSGFIIQKRISDKKNEI